VKILRTTDDLALFGGTPAFPTVLHVGQPNIGDRSALFARLDQILDGKWLTNNGPMVQELEKRIADLIGVKHCIAMCNGTIALEIAVRALGLSGEVIVPSFTFIATAHCLQWQEITPVFCDVDPLTHSIDPTKVEQLITPRTSGIIGVHLWGAPCNTAALEVIADRHGLALLFDASHAFGCTSVGRGIGNFGRAEVFSFHATKFINAFEGGAVTTNDDELAAKIRLMKNFGFHGLDNVVYIGTNGKMSEPSAAMALTSLDSMSDIVSQNRRNYAQYHERLSCLPGIRFYCYDDSNTCNFQYIVCEVDATTTGISRDTLVATFHAENIRARRYFYPGCHRMEPYRSRYPSVGHLLPVTEKLAGEVLCLPTGTNITQSDIATVSDVFEFAVTRGHEISRRIEQTFSPADRP
jgi:dTDP-4-amino-4,6-dideoxygalactose transaminase